MSRKGQIWSADFIVGIATFLFMLLIFALAWRMLDVRWHHSSEYRQMQTDALFASEALMVTPGDPPSWEAMPDLNASRSLGLAWSRNVISSSKLARLASENSTSYYTVRERLGIQRYELGIRVMDMSREDVLFEFGRFPGANADSVVLERLGLLDGSPVVVRMEVWK
ncbi:hypothetical protein L0Y65_03110 [Candidatus Micrarchaeota archaeon]|nr:hypothetical protein [Candidatus Micrarchaeota archaeon]